MSVGAGTRWPPGPVPDLAQLRLLVADAADRAAAMLTDAYPAAEADDPLVDAVRILATPKGGCIPPRRPA